MELGMTEPDFLEKPFCPKNLGNGPKKAKNRVF